MPERATRPDDTSHEALNEIVEAWLQYIGPKEARGFLRSFAARLAASEMDPSVVPIRRQSRPLRPVTREWLLERLPAWLMRHG